MKSDLTLKEKLEMGSYEESDPKQRNQNKRKAIETRSKKIGKILTNLRLNINMTQQETATAIGIAQTTYAGYETGRHEPSIEILIKLADIYKVSMDYITGRYDESENEDLSPDEENATIREIIDAENYTSLMSYRETQKQIIEECKKRGTYNRAKKKK